MSNNSKQPREYDVVLGGNAPPPVAGAVLGGIEGVRNRLASPLVEVRVAALKDALNYGNTGLKLVIKALKDASKQVQREAYVLLQKRVEPQVKRALRNYKPWNLVERLKINGYPGYAKTFAKRKVKVFDVKTGISDPVKIAYSLRIEELWESNENDPDKLELMLQNSQVNQVEALVFGVWPGYGSGDSNSRVVNALVAAKNRLTNLKAVFIGDIIREESEISWINQSDISPVLEAYPNLEILQVRGGEGLAFSAVRHENLEALIVETGGLSRETIAQIFALKLPALNHLELWLGTDSYGGNSSVEDLKPILEDLVFPHLKYLGLRNSEYSDDIAKAVVRSPLMETINVIDLSMGTLTDNGAEILLNCPTINQLDILNVSANYLSDEMLERLSELDVKLMAGEQKDEYEYDDEKAERYCSVTE